MARFDLRRGWSYHPNSVPMTTRCYGHQIGVAEVVNLDRATIFASKLGALDIAPFLSIRAFQGKDG